MGVSPGALSSMSSSFSSASAQAVEPPLHDDVAGGARAAPAAGVLERHAVGEQDVENGARPAVVLERCVPRVELDHAIGLAALEVDDDRGHAALVLADITQCGERDGPRARNAGGAPRRWCKSRAAMAIHYEKDGHVVTITIDRPEARNSLDLEHFGQLADCWVRFRDDDEAFVAILTGVRRRVLRRRRPEEVHLHRDRARRQARGRRVDAEGRRARSTRMAHSLVAVLRDGAIAARDGSEFKLYKPVIAAINGICAAGGLEMMWNTDLRVVRRRRLVPARRAAPRSLPRRRLDRAQRAPALVVQRDGGRCCSPIASRRSARSRWGWSTASCRATR